VEASALHAPASINRLSISTPLLRLRSDEQLVALFRAGSENAFEAIHDRYRQRLFAYVRQMLSAHSRQDAEDVLQDVFVRAFGALRNDDREVNVRAWLYRVAHNRCIDHLRRPTPPPADIYEVSRSPLHDPIEDAQRREDLARLVHDVGRLPEQQRSALLMREIDGMSYADLAAALEVTVPAVKSLLVRARVGLVEAAEARDTDCEIIRSDLVGAYDRGVKASGRARRHLRECSSCQDYRTALRGIRRSFAALSPGLAGPAALLTHVFGIGGSGAAAGGAAATASSGGALTAAGGGLATVTACKVAAVVCTAVVTAGGAVEVERLTSHTTPASRSVARAAAAPVPTTPAVRHAALTSAAASAPEPMALRIVDRPATRPATTTPSDEVIAAPPLEALNSPSDLSAPAGEHGAISAPVGEIDATGGVTAPPEPAEASVPTSPAGPAAPAAEEPAAGSAPAPAEPAASSAEPAASKAPASGGSAQPSGP